MRGGPALLTLVSFPRVLVARLTIQTEDPLSEGPAPMHVAPRWYTGHVVAAMLSACAPAQAENQPPRAVPSSEPEPGRNWVTLTRISDASHEIDARSVVPGANGTFTLRYRARMPAFTNPVGERIDRFEGVVEIRLHGWTRADAHGGGEDG